MLPSPAVISAVADLFREAYEGPQDPSSTWFTDNQPGSGVLGVLDALSSVQASTPLGGSGAPQQGATIAAHAEHLRWSLALSNALARGEQPEGDWEQSWSVRTVTAEEWERLRMALRQEYTSLLQAIQARGNLPAELVTPGIAIVAHGAYHLGAIRQMVRLLQIAV